jgi:hypothetical protein
MNTAISQPRAFPYEVTMADWQSGNKGLDILWGDILISSNSMDFIGILGIKMSLPAPGGQR